MLFSLRLQYSPESLQALIENPSDRSQTAQQICESVNGNLVGFWGTTGGKRQGALIIAEVQDDTSQAAIINAIIASGVASSVETQRLYNNTDTVENLRRAQTVRNAYQAPGQAQRRS